MKNIGNKIIRIGENLKQFAEKYMPFLKREELLTVESKFGEASLRDYDARFEGSNPEINVNDGLEYFNKLSGPDSLAGTV